MEVKYYNSIEELPLSKFKEALVKKNLYALVISGDPKKEELQAAWNNIVYQYNDEMQDNEDKLYLKKYEELVYSETKLRKFECCVAVLQTEINFPALVVPERRFADYLNEYIDAQFSFDHSDPVQFRNDLDRARKRGKSFLMDFELKTMQFEAIKQRNADKEIDPNSRPTMKYFDSVLNNLSIFCKYEVTDSITVSRFTDLVKKYIAYNKFLEEQKNKR